MRRADGVGAGAFGGGETFDADVGDQVAVGVGRVGAVGV